MVRSFLTLTGLELNWFLESLGLADSGDFYDFYAFLHLVKQLESESQAERKYRKSTQKRRLLDSTDSKASDFLQRSQMYEKLIYQNPQFIPRDAFNEIFNIIKCNSMISIIKASFQSARK